MTCTTISSALDFDAMRDALRTRVSDSGSAGDGDHDAFPGLPRVGDLVVGAVLLQGGVDLVGQP